MNFSEIWIRRPVMTTLVMASLLLFGVISYRRLPINNLPTVDFPTISVKAVLPGANPEVMASTVATPLEKQFSSISGIDSMTSTSTLGVTNINIQFALSRSIDAAALDVSSAIAAAMGVLPREMPNPPTYVKVNPADMPIVIMSLTSDSLPVTSLNDFAENVLMANLSLIDGVAQIDLAPPQKYSVRVQVNPDKLVNRGIGINEVAEALRAGNVNLPGGTLDGKASAYTLNPDGQLANAKAFGNLVVTYQNGNPVRVRDLGRAVDGVENDRSCSWYLNDGQAKLAVMLRVSKQAGANTVLVVDRIKSKMPGLRASMPGAMQLDVVFDQSAFIEESVIDVQVTMVLTILLVVLVIFLFIRAWRPTIIPSFVVPLSLISTFTVMGLCSYTLNTLSLMALTLSIGFVVDDAIVVLENIIRRMESGEAAMEASLRGSREIAFTVLSMTVSLAVVFIPIMFMGGILGRLFREFAVSITSAILLSGLLSLTLTPMLASRLLIGFSEKRSGTLYNTSERAFTALLGFYGRTLQGVMRHRVLVLVFTLGVATLMVLLFRTLPKGFIPSQDQNFFRIFSQVDDSTSFPEMVRHQESLNAILLKDPDTGRSRMASIVGLGGGASALAFVALPPRGERDSSIDDVIERLRPQMNQVPGLIVSLVNPPLITIGSRMASAQWQFTLQSSDLDDLYTYGALMEEKLRTIPALTDVKSDLRVKMPRVEIEVDRDKASAVGLSLRQIQDAFYSAFGQRQVSTIYSSANFYYVILELEPEFREKPSSLERLYLRAPGGALVPLKAVARSRETVAPLTVNHSGQIPAATISFNLKPSFAIGPAIEAIQRFAAETLPASVHTGFQGTAQAFQASLSSMGFLLIITVVIIYIVLGVLYESFVHPLTILTSLPLAGFGALAALWLFHLELDMYAYVGVIMLIGIVKKNGIMMVDFALEAERARNLAPEESIHEACMTRFRPIMMTTMAALFGTLPIAIGWGAGGEARRSLGIAVVGGLLFSQLMTLYVTPVFYVYFDRLNRWFHRHHDTGRQPAA